MHLKIYDTLAAKNKDFTPKGTARIFLCGPTLYDYSHAGHARMLLFYDMVARYLRFSGVETKVVVNITDIDPKIFAKAKAEGGRTPKDVATFYMGELLYDTSALNIDSFAFALVSDHVQVAQMLTRRLLEGGKAYGASGNIYLDGKAAGFGRLSKMTEEELADIRLDIAPGKKSPFDILLWSTGEDMFNFPDITLGSGIPWWHLQDTSVAMAAFNGKYDMHGGASELAYPHHESHLAQLTALTSDKEPVKLWTHVGLVYINGEKMSKSLGNTVTIRGLLQDYGANAIRLYFYSSAHYRKRLDFAEKDIAKCAGLDSTISSAIGKECNAKYMKKFMQRMNDDFDTPAAVEVALDAARAGAGTGEMAKILGLRY